MCMSSEITAKALVSLLWSQYSKLSEPQKEGFFNLAQSIAKKTTNENISKKELKLLNSEKPAKNISEFLPRPARTERKKQRFCRKSI